jgi:predicted negative regulator of RcsB-dependent stress response
MSVPRTSSRFAGRAVGATIMARTVKRYPIVAVVWFGWRWWQRRAAREERSTVRLRAGETITVQDKRN